MFVYLVVATFNSSQYPLLENGILFDSPTDKQSGNRDFIAHYDALKSNYSLPKLCNFYCVHSSVCVCVYACECE